MKAIGYIRVSTAGQVEGEGLGVQRDRITGWCGYQSLSSPEIYEDAGISGSTTDRPGFQGAIRRVLALGEEGVLLVYSLSRLGRNSIDVQETLAVLLDGGVRVVSLSDGIDSGSGMGATLLKLLTSILATFAELERETIRTRLLDGRRRADRENRIYAVEPRYGRKVEGALSKTLLDDPVEQAAIVRIKDLREQGLSYRSICRQLGEEGINPRRAELWSPAVVRRIVMGRVKVKAKPRSKRVQRARAEFMAAPLADSVGPVAATSPGSQAEAVAQHLKLRRLPTGSG